MARLAAETGGTDFDARKKNLQGSFEAIAEELHSSYRLAYHSTNPASDGTFRAVRIRVKQPGYEVRAKSGYLSKTGD
jgi:VWFA-related protein